MHGWSCQSQPQVQNNVTWHHRFCDVTSPGVYCGWANVRAFGGCVRFVTRSFDSWWSAALPTGGRTDVRRRARHKLRMMTPRLSSLTSRRRRRMRSSENGRLFGVGGVGGGTVLFRTVRYGGGNALSDFSRSWCASYCTALWRHAAAAAQVRQPTAGNCVIISRECLRPTGRKCFDDCRIFVIWMLNILQCSSVHIYPCCYLKKVKVAHTRSPSVGFRSWSRFLAVRLQSSWVINPAVGCHYFPPGLQLPPQPLRGLLPISLLGEQRHDGCEQFA